MYILINDLFIFQYPYLEIITFIMSIFNYQHHYAFHSSRPSLAICNSAINGKTRSSDVMSIYCVITKLGCMVSIEQSIASIAFIFLDFLLDFNDYLWFDFQRITIKHATPWTPRSKPNVLSSTTSNKQQKKNSKWVCIFLYFLKGLKFHLISRYFIFIIGCKSKVPNKEFKLYIIYIQSWSLMIIW